MDVTTEPTTPHQEGFYLIWSPQGKTPPKVIYGTHRHCTRQAAKMAQAHPGQDFYVMRGKARLFRGNEDAKVTYTNLPKRKEDYRKNMTPTTNNFSQQMETIRQQVLSKAPHLSMVDIHLGYEYNPVTQNETYSLSAYGYTGRTRIFMGTVVRDSWQSCFDTATQLIQGNPQITKSETSSWEKAGFEGLAEILQQAGAAGSPGGGGGYGTGSEVNAGTVSGARSTSGSAS